MAGKNETPRQKMIGMMYLVLTALLALNVSKTVLEKFVTLSDTLHGTVVESKVKNAETVANIEKQVGILGNRPKDTKVLTSAQTIRSKTDEVLAKIQDFKTQIEGPRDEADQLVGIDNEVNVGQIMVVNKGGDELRDVLNGYTEFLKSETGLDFPKMALDADENPQYKDDPNQKGKDFKTLNFEHTPMAAALAQLSQFESEIMNHESTALSNLAEKVGAEDVKFDKIVPMVRPDSRIVAAGAKYRAEMFISASSTAVTPTMKKDGKDIKVEDGKGIVEFTATPGKYDKEGLAKKTYKAEITIKKPGGSDTTYTEEIEYFVAKPVIQIQSDAVQALYLGCGNNLQVNVPALGTAYNPSFTSSGAKCYPGKQKGKVTVVPNAKEVALTVSSGGNRIGTEKFKVRPVPKPSIALFTRGKPVNEKSGEKISNMRSISIKALAEEGFKAFLPDDARYRVTKWTITLARGPRPVGTPISATGQEVNISRLMKTAKPGDRLSIDVKQVKRRNFRNQTENSSVTNRYVTVPLN